MALACDLIIAADHARLGVPEPRVGRMAGAGGVHRLPRMIPPKIAMGYILTGRHMTAQEAHRLGVVNEVVPLPQLMPTALKWAGEILECAPLSIRASKQAAMMGLGQPLDVALRLGYTEAERMRRSEDTVEGPRAFAEKRKPNRKARGPQRRRRRGKASAAARASATRRTPLIPRATLAPNSDARAPIWSWPSGARPMAATHAPPARPRSAA